LCNIQLGENFAARKLTGPAIFFKGKLDTATFACFTNGRLLGMIQFTVQTEVLPSLGQKIGSLVRWDIVDLR